MPGIRYCFIFSLFFLTSISHAQTPQHLKRQVIISDQAIAKANKYASKVNSDPVIADKLYQNAMEEYNKLVQHLAIEPNDSVSMIAYNHLGFLNYYFDSLSLAKSHYLKALWLHKKYHFLPDSSLFPSFIFTGSIYYRENMFDSAYYYFKIAESINDKIKNSLPETQRLYNWLGGMYYETGNYKQAKNYFEKALSMLKPSHPYAKDLAIRYENNIAASLVKLEQFAVADSIYKILLAKGINTNELKNNRGIVNLKSGNYKAALGFFKSVVFENDLKITLYNHIGYTYAMTGFPDSAALYYNKALLENSKWSGEKKNLKHGYTLQNIARLKESQDSLQLAIQAYQSAMLQFYPSYNSLDSYANPDTFSGIFSYLDLFNVLIAKGDVFEKMYRQTDSVHHLDASLKAYASAFKLVHYVDQMYDSDDARLFLNSIKYGVHDKPIQLSLIAYTKTKNKEYLSKAYFFDQQNKASILTYNVQEQSIKNKNKNITDLFEREKALKSQITRMVLKANQTRDSANLSKYNIQIRDAEIELSKIQEQKNAFPQFKSLPQTIPQVPELQQSLGDATAVISYHLSKHSIVIIVITKNSIDQTVVAIDSQFYQNVSDFKTSLDPGSLPSQYKGMALSQSLYNQLIVPIYATIRDKKKLIIIPDDELNSLPFEALQDQDEMYLVRKFNIHYQYSTSLLLSKTKNKKYLPVLALAPFANQGLGHYSQLLYSRQEIESLPGKILLNQLASKKACLTNINGYPVIHLATHTFIDETTPDNSHIAFSQEGDSTDSKLFLPEIYNLPLDSTSLVILSACESAYGKLTKGEGMMSLSRAFYYAGCPNIIAALWKADDQSTSWILQKFYRYIHKGYSISSSLHQAKLDYLNSSEIENQYKTPYFWAHLVLTGELDQTDTTSTWYIYVTILVILIPFGIALKKLFKKAIA